MTPNPNPNLNHTRTLHHASVDLNDMIVLDPWRIRRQYSITWFLPDLVSSIPLDVIMMAAGASETSSRASRMARTSKMVKMLRLVRLAKVFRLMRVGKVFTLVRLFKMHLEDKLGFRISDGTAKLVRLVFFLLVAAHWIACLSYAIVRIADYPAGSWVTEMKLHCGDEPEGFIEEIYNYTSDKWLDDDACEVTVERSAPPAYAAATLPPPPRARTPLSPLPIHPHGLCHEAVLLLRQRRRRGHGGPVLLVAVQGPLLDDPAREYRDQLGDPIL